MASFRLDVRRNVLRFLRDNDDRELAEDMIQRLLALAENPVPVEATSISQAAGLYLLDLQEAEFLYRVNDGQRLITVYGNQRKSAPSGA